MTSAGDGGYRYIGGGREIVAMEFLEFWSFDFIIVKSKEGAV